MIRELCLECGSKALKAIKMVSKGRKLLKVPLKLMKNPAHISISYVCTECSHALTLRDESEEALIKRIERLEKYYS